MAIFSPLLASLPMRRAAAQCSAQSATAVTITGTGTCSTLGSPVNNVVIPRLGAIVAISPLSASTFSIGTASVTDFDATWKDLAATISVQANRPFDIQVQGLNATFSATNDATFGSGVAAWSSKPVGDLGLSTVSTGPFTDLTTSTGTLTSKVAGNYITGAAGLINVYLRLYLDYGTDKPGTYTLNNIKITLYLN